MHADHELGEMLRKSAGDHLMQLVVLVAAQESQTTRRLAAMPDESSGIHIHFAIADALAITQG
jgi:hypothetical protein